MTTFRTPWTFLPFFTLVGAPAREPRTVTRRVLTVVVATSLSVACGDSGAPATTTAPESFAGTYDLVSVNGTPLPFVAGVFTITAAVLTLGGDGSATWSVEVNDPTPRSVVAFTGTYAVSRSTITLDGADIDGDPVGFTGTVSGDAITLTAPPTTWEFRRR